MTNRPHRRCRDVLWPLVAVGFLFASVESSFAQVVADESAPASNNFTIDPYVDSAAPLIQNPYATSPETTPQSFDSVPDKLTLDTPTTAPSTSPTAAPEKEKNGEFLAVPIPSHKPGFGWGLNLMLGYIFKVDPNDKISPPSTVGAFGFYSENESWAAGVVGKFHLKEDQYRVTGALFTGQINYSFSGVGTAAGESGLSVPLEQKMQAGVFEFLDRIAPKLFLGPRYMYANIHTTADLSSINLPVPPSPQLDSNVSAIGVHAQWDTRDSQFYPRSGGLLDLSGDFHDTAWGDDFDYQIYKLSYNRYITIRDKQVLALRGAAQFCEGDVPFYSLAAFGRGPDLRGYSYGQFQDNTLVAVQGEYRIELTKRIGAVAFAGVGEVGPDLGSYTFDNLLPSAGVGLRFLLAEQNHVSLRVDAAWGREGGEFYLAVGEAF